MYDEGIVLVNQGLRVYRVDDGLHLKRVTGDILLPKDQAVPYDTMREMLISSANIVIGLSTETATTTTLVC